MKIHNIIRAFVLIFGGFNLIWGTMLFFYYPKIPYTVISNIIPQALWAITFLTSGVLMFYSAIKQKVNLAYAMMLVGLFIKSVWEVGLLLRLNFGGTPPLIILWGLAFCIQFATVIYFKEIPDERV